MTLSDFRRITDELLSAYIDGEVTEQERALVEAAIAQDEEIAWRLNSLRQTVTLLRELPEVALPRSFTLSFEQLALPTSEDIAAVDATERAAVATRPQRKAAPTTQAGFWEQLNEGWRRFWQAGNPVLRNAAAVSFVLMLMLTGGGQLLNRAMQPTGPLASVPDTVPAAAPAMEAAASAESVALAPTATEEASAGAAAAEATPTEEVAALAVQEGTSSKAPIAEDNARMQAQDASSEQATESAAVASDAASSAAVEAGEAAVAEVAPSEGEAAEAGIAAIMAAPESTEIMPPVVASPPFPGGRDAGAGGAGGAGGDNAMAGVPIVPHGAGGGGETGGLVPEQAYQFDVDPDVPPQAPPAGEAVSASIMAAPVEEAPAESVADMASTPAVDAPAETEAVSAAVAADTTDEAIADEEAEAEESAPVVEQPEAEQAPAVVASARVADNQRAIPPTTEPTPAAVAAVAPGTITSSDVIENIETEDGVVSMTNTGFNLPVVWIAQGTALLLTVVLASLWWRSRTPHR